MFFSFCVSVVGLVCLWPFSNSFSSLGPGVSFGGVFCVDYVSFCLSLLSVLIMVSLSFWWNRFSLFSRSMLGVSLFSSIFCYSCVHALWFWIFYEMSIVPLLILLALDSPYSERYVALWYFLGYVVFGSLPMILCLFYFAEVNGSFDIRFWDTCCLDLSSLAVVFVLGILFVSKIPLLPFHVWLPIVHAEASSPVSVCLSGYVMKLGLLGVFRFCWDFVPLHFLGENYISVCLLASIGFFFGALRELDAKRWLALLSLGHISVGVACLSLGGWQVYWFGFVYSLGHGLSAAGMFILIWVVSDLSGSRNFILMKHAFCGSFWFRVCLGLVLGTVCCVPPSVQFFSELFLMIEVVWFNNWFLACLLYVYIFLSGLVPVLFFGVLVTRRYDVSFFSSSFFVRLGSIFFLIFWSFILFMLC